MTENQSGSLVRKALVILGDNSHNILGFLPKGQVESRMTSTAVELERLYGTDAVARLREPTPGVLTPILKTNQEAIEAFAFFGHGADPVDGREQAQLFLTPPFGKLEQQHKLVPGQVKQNGPYPNLKCVLLYACSQATPDNLKKWSAAFGLESKLVFGFDYSVRPVFEGGAMAKRFLYCLEHGYDALLARDAQQKREEEAKLAIRRK
jgi:hypothetical protein